MSNVGYADITAIAQQYASAGGSAKVAAAQAVRDVVLDVEELARQYAPARTGLLRSSIGSYVDGLTGVVYASAPYSQFVELGTGTRGEFPTGMITIRPRTAKVLRWVGADGKVHFAHVVHSPGMKAHPFLRPALEDVLAKFESDLAVAVVSSIVKGPNA